MKSIMCKTKRFTIHPTKNNFTSNMHKERKIKKSQQLSTKASLAAVNII